MSFSAAPRDNCTDAAEQHRATTRIALATIGEIIADRPIDVTIVCFSEADKEFYITQD